MNKLNTAFFCDLSHKTGLGHLKRMNNLSHHLDKKNILSYYIFDVKSKKYIDKLNLKANIRFIEIKSNQRLVSLLNSLDIKLIIFDSYKIKYSLKKFIREKKFFTISIVDHIKKDPSNLIFANRINQNYVYKKSKIFFGPEYIIANQKNIRNEIKNTNINNIKILIHAGGASLYSNFEFFYKKTFKFIKENNLEATILCTNESSRLYLKKIIDKSSLKKHFKFLDFQKNLNKKLKSFNIVIGPAGTTTYESILLGCLPISFQISNDGRDCEKTWNSIGNFLHLKYSELNKSKVINGILNLSISKYKILQNLININAKVIDGKGANRVSKIILKEFHKKINKKLSNEKNKLLNTQELVIQKCNYSDMRDYLSARNLKKNRIVSSKPGHIILWPEHINWWLDKKIIKFKIVYYDNVVGYCWLKKNIDSKGIFITSGWFFNNMIKNKLKVSVFIQNQQNILAKKFFKKLNWIIITKKNNEFVHFLNKKIGFYNANSISIDRAMNVFNINKDDYFIMEKKI